jgi:chemotaxis protein methyltransferase CheR
MEDLTISKDDFCRFQEFFYRKTGIQFEESKRYLSTNGWLNGSKRPTREPFATIS